MLIGSLQSEFCDYLKFVRDNEDIVNKLIQQVQSSLSQDDDYKALDEDGKRERVAIMVSFLLLEGEEEYSGEPIPYDGDESKIDIVCAFSGYVLSEIYFRALEAKGIVKQLPNKEWQETSFGKKIGQSIKAENEFSNKRNN